MSWTQAREASRKIGSEPLTQTTDAAHTGSLSRASQLRSQHFGGGERNKRGCITISVFIGGMPESISLCVSAEHG